MSFKLDSTHKTTLSRQIRESLLIQDENPTMLINSKSEWGSQNTIPRVIIESGDREANQDLQSQTPPDQQSDQIDARKRRGNTHERQTLLNFQSCKRQRAEGSSSISRSDEANSKPQDQSSAKLCQGKEAWMENSVHRPENHEERPIRSQERQNLRAKGYREGAELQQEGK